MTDIDVKEYKKLFYEKMQPYIEKEIIRVVYSSDHVSIFSLGEIYYVACAHVLIGDIPVGVYVNENVFKKIVNKNRFIYPLIEEVFSDLHLNNDIVFDFTPDTDRWVKWIKEAREKNVSRINPEFEEEIRQMSNKEKVHSDNGTIASMKAFLRKNKKSGF